MVPLADAVTLGDDDAVGALHGAAHVGLQLRAMHLAVLMDGVYLPVVVEQHAEVVNVALHVMVRPRPVDVLRRIALQTLAVDVREHIELSVGVADAWCPDALAVYLLMVLQREAILWEVETVEAV